MEMKNMKSRSYTELMKLPTFEERFRYLQMNGKVGEETFGHDRWINQRFYKKDPKWLEARDKVIIRDGGCDLGCPDREIKGIIHVHHLNKVTKDQILRGDPALYDPENLITVSSLTHKAIEYGNEDLLIKDPVKRRPNDTCPWRH